MTVAALPFEQRRDRVAERGLAAVADVQRAGRIGRHELDDDALAGARVAAPDSGRRPRARAATTALPRGSLEREVDEARARRLGASIRSERRLERRDDRAARARADCAARRFASTSATFVA